MTIKHKIDLAFIFIVPIIGGLLFYTFRSSEHLREMSEFTDEAREINFHLNDMLSNVLEAESGQRGYVLTGKRDFLHSYRDGKSLLPQCLDTLSRLLREKPTYERDFLILEDLIRRKLLLNDSAVGLKSRGFSAEASQLISTGHGKLLMDSIKTLHNAMEASLIGLVNREQYGKKVEALDSTRTFIVLSFLIAGVLLGGYFTLRRNATFMLDYQERQKSLIYELNSRNQQLDDFTHIVSHNLRSSSSNIGSLVSMIVDEPSSPNAEIVAMLRKTSANLTATLNDMLETLHAKTAADLPKETINLLDLCEKVIESLSADIINSKAEIQTDFSEVSSVVYPKVYLESILHNLISNAIKYAHPDRKPVIRINSTKRNKRVTLRVTDNGQGIDLEAHGRKLFGYRKTFHDHPHAKGVGLFMVKNQVEILGGAVHVESEKGNGCSFQITL